MNGIQENLYTTLLKETDKSTSMVNPAETGLQENPMKKYKTGNNQMVDSSKM